MTDLYVHKVDFYEQLLEYACPERVKYTLVDDAWSYFRIYLRETYGEATGRHVYRQYDEQGGDTIETDIELDGQTILVTIRRKED
jgi:hypothetical protein